MSNSGDVESGPWGIRRLGWLVLLVFSVSGCGPSVPADPEALKAFSGRYQASPDTVVSVRPDRDHLVLEINRGQPMEFFPESADRFRHRGSPTRIGFTRNATGAVTELILFREGEHRAPRLAGNSDSDGIQVVRTGGVEIRYRITGAGPATVVLFGGLDRWVPIRKGAEPRARVISCELQAGPGPRRSAREQAAALTALLDACGATSPIILVGHSFGGALVRLAAAQSSGRVDGLVLVDPFHEGFADWLRDHQPGNFARFRAECLQNYASDWDGLLKDLRDAHPTANQRVVLLTAGRRQIRNGNALEQGVEAAAFDEAAQAVRAAHQSWISGVPGGRHVVVPRAGHEIPTEDPAAVVAAMVALLDSPGPVAP
ncbi:MAG: alpha/beta fold hydrolase [Verrucomicrobiales bacterium]|nr:alpha/beta fold hydrolase [Verrucomicrobiales bacterium]